MDLVFFADNQHGFSVSDGCDKADLLSHSSSQVRRAAASCLSPWAAAAVRSLSTSRGLDTAGITLSLLYIGLSYYLPDLPIAQPLREEVEDIMNRCWLSTRRQLLFYLSTCIAIISNYFITSFVINSYRYFTQPHGNYEVVLREYL